MGWNFNKAKKGRFSEICCASLQPKNRGPEGSVSFFRLILILSFLTFEGGAVWLFLNQSPFFGMNYEGGVVILHVAASLILPIALFPWLPLSYQQNGWLSSSLIFGLSGALPVFGPLCVLVILKSLNKTQTGQTSERSGSFVTGSQAPNVEDDDFVSRSGEAQSILQIMIGPDPLARRNLILATRRLCVEQAIPILRTGLRDEDDEVKLYSQAILSQLVEQYEKTIFDLKKTLETSPEDTESMVRLAAQYFEVVELDLITDEGLQIFYIKRSIAILEQVMIHEQDNEEVMLALVKYHLRVEQTDEATAFIQRLRDRGVSAELIEPLEVELLYLGRSWDRFRARVREGLLNRFCDPKLLSVEEFWFGRNPSFERSRLPDSIARLAG